MHAQVTASLLLYTAVSLVGVFVHEARERERRALFVRVWTSCAAAVRLEDEAARTVSSPRRRLACHTRGHMIT